jgi:probable HAF family extracellular repeat protein
MLYEIETLPGNTYGTAISDAGQVVGQLYPSEGYRTAFLWTPETGLVEDLGVPARDILFSHAINNLEVVVGTYQLEGGTGDSVRMLGLATAERTFRTLAVNAHEEVVGWYIVDGVRRAFYWSEAQGLVDLHMVWSLDVGFVQLPTPDDLPATANGINNLGQVVGVVGSVPLNRTTVVWTPVAGGLTDELTELIDELVESGALSGSHAHGLRAKLRQIEQKIDAGQTAAAINQLHAFIGHVEALVASGHLDADEGAELIEAAQALLEALA